MKDEKLFGIHRGYIEIAIILIVMILLLGGLVSQASAAVTNQTINQTITAAPTPVPTVAPVTTVPPAVRRIDQGGCVEVGETIDISGIGWYTGYIAWFNRYRTEKTEGLNATKVYEIQPWELRHYYIDPALFSKFPGNWYSHYEKVESGNSLLFKVAETKCLQGNESLVPLVVENKTITLIAENFTLSAKTIPNVDYIISRNLPSMLETEYDSRYWMFGRNPDDNLYDIPVTDDGMIAISKEFSNKLMVGNYKIIDVYPGENFIIEERYDEPTESITSPFRDVAPVPIGSKTSAEIIKLLKAQIKKSIDDTTTELNITVEDPYVEVRRLDNLANADGTNSVMISGYTNANIGDTITLEFDKGHIDSKLIAANTWTTTVEDGGGINAYRTWYKTAIFNPNDFTPDQHTITITTGSGASVNAPIFIRKELAANYNPPDYIQFIDNSPFIPVPTVPPAPPPVTVTVVQTVVKEKIVEKEKIVTVDPYPYMIGGTVAVIVVAYALFSVARAAMLARRTKQLKKE
jgi:hypothetical protein